MLDIGSKIVELRKRKNWSQADLVKAIEASRDIIGKYERNENSPSVEMALKIARVFDVPVDYLLGEGKHAAYDKNTVKRIEGIKALPPGRKRQNLLFHRHGHHTPQNKKSFR